MDYEDRRNEQRSGPLTGKRIDPFVSEFDMGLARPLSRSVRLNGFATCLRLEQVYWISWAIWPGSTVVRSVHCCPTWIAKCICVMEG
jgi:hypothetical protein